MLKSVSEDVLVRTPGYPIPCGLVTLSMHMRPKVNMTGRMCMKGVCSLIIVESTTYITRHQPTGRYRLPGYVEQQLVASGTALCYGALLGVNVGLCGSLAKGDTGF